MSWLIMSCDRDLQDLKAVGTYLAEATAGGWLPPPGIPGTPTRGTRVRAGS